MWKFFTRIHRTYNLFPTRSIEAAVVFPVSRVAPRSACIVNYPGMHIRFLILGLLCLCSVMIPGPHLQIFAQDQVGEREWFLGPFQKQLAVNPILSPSPSSTFFCPVQKDSVNWERRHLFNPGAVVRKGKVFLLYRAEDGFWESGSTSRIGLAWSEDGMHFQRRPEPVLYPDGGSATRYEWPGGCEDPRVVETEAGLYVLTYTAWNRKTARLSVATSYDLIHWSKHGLAFGKSFNGRYRDFWSKSGSIICGNKENHFVPEQINGHYWMYWGDSNIYLAWSDDLINWTPIERPGLPSDDGALMGEALRDRLLPVLSVRNGYFDTNKTTFSRPSATRVWISLLSLFYDKKRDKRCFERADYAFCKQS